jgi:hypothetical protein
MDIPASTTTEALPPAEVSSSAASLPNTSLWIRVSSAKASPTESAIAEHIAARRSAVVPLSLLVRVEASPAKSGIAEHASTRRSTALPCTLLTRVGASLAEPAVSKPGVSEQTPTWRLAFVF